ncbi:MAG: antitoxin AF2212-like protein [Thermodesulfobacteriota bacterium]
MSEVINAVFENGIFKPIEKIEMKEHEKVTKKKNSRCIFQT